MTKNKVLAILCAMLIAVILSFPLQSAFAAETIDTHFFVRYDSTVQDENGNTHYSPANYFPIGEVASDYVYGSSNTDYTSVDGQVYNKDAFVPGAEQLITKGNINLYNQFGVNIDTLKPFFTDVYSNIAESPHKEAVANAIGNALGPKWKQAYIDEQIDVLWYVCKFETSNREHVDGVLYWVQSGESADKSDIDASGNPKDPGTDDSYDPEPEEPLDPEFNVDEEPEQPATPVEPSIDENQENDASIQHPILAQSTNDKIAQTTDTAKTIDTNQLPQTGDIDLPMVIILCVSGILFAFGVIYYFGNKD